MAVGDITIFNQAYVDFGNGEHNVTGNTIKVALIRGAASGGIDPVATTPDPRWGAGGSNNLSTHQVTTGSVYLTGGATLSGKTFTSITNRATLRASVLAWALDAATGFTNARWAIIYNDTNAGKRCIAFVDLGSIRNLTAEGLSLNWSGASRDIFTIGAT